MRSSKCRRVCRDGFDNLFRERGHREGAYIVELAIAIPIVFMVVFSGFELMHFFKIRHAANQASYEAARRLIIPGGTSAEALAAANQIANANMLTIDSISVTPSVINRDTREVTVQLSIRFRNEWSFARLLAGRTIVSRCTLMHEYSSIYRN
jgi:Flp pilus assembly protein TadG